MLLLWHLKVTYNLVKIINYSIPLAVQVFGGLGYTRGGQGARVERIYREVKANAILGGSEEIMIDLGVKMASRYYPKHAKL